MGIRHSTTKHQRRVFSKRSWEIISCSTNFENNRTKETYRKIWPTNAQLNIIPICLHLMRLQKDLSLMPPSALKLKKRMDHHHLHNIRGLSLRLSSCSTYRLQGLELDPPG